MQDKNAYDEKTSFTDEEITQLKAQHGSLTIIVLTKKQENIVSTEGQVVKAPQLTFIFKKPTRQIMSLATSRVSKTKNAGDYMDVIIDSTSLNGATLLQDGSIYIAVQTKLDDLLTDYNVEVKKN